MKTSLEKYDEEFDRIVASPDFRYGLAQSFVTRLLALPYKERTELLPLFKRIEDVSFQKGVVLSNLNYAELFKEDENRGLGKEKSTKNTRSEEVPVDDFNNILFYVTSKHQSLFLRIKGFFIFKLENVEKRSTKVVLLSDDDCSKHPEVTSFDSQNDRYDIQKHTIKEFLEQISKDDSLRNQNYICIFLVASNLRNKEIADTEVRNLLDLFSVSNFISVKKMPISSTDDYGIRGSELGIDDIRSYSSKIFNNRVLSFEEETVIKKLFENPEMVLEYRILKSGTTGAKVIEIQPLKAYHPQIGRFVVKFARIQPERKIKNELRLFNMYVRDLNIPSYAEAHAETNSYEAIRYSYASSDGKKDSYEFSELIDQYIQDKYDKEYSISTVIDQLFTCAPFVRWKDSLHPVAEEVEILYADYLKSENRVIETIALIRNLSDVQIEQDTLIRNFRRIKKYRLSTKKKICHGDLHSMNFFKDDEGVYIIDFGWTDIRHSLIDHATLECSIKFKHLPFYIPEDEKMEWEKKLLDGRSFSSGFDLSFITRNKPRDIFNLIIQLREESLNFTANPESTLEYLVALFIISFRQIQYLDLNQSYALNSAEIISEEIIRLIDIDTTAARA